MLRLIVNTFIALKVGAYDKHNFFMGVGGLLVKCKNISPTNMTKLRHPQYYVYPRDFRTYFSLLYGT